jgi:hypothetical protein
MPSWRVNRPKSDLILQKGGRCSTSLSQSHRQSLLFDIPNIPWQAKTALPYFELSKSIAYRKKSNHTAHPERNLRKGERNEKDGKASLHDYFSRPGDTQFRYVDSGWELPEKIGADYPRALQGEEILIEARILAVADVVEAMASHRPYRAALCLDAALAEIEKNKGTLYDPAAVEICLRLFREKGYQIEGAWFQTLILTAMMNPKLLLCRVCRVKRMTCRLKSDGGSSVVRPCSWREV